MPSDVRVRALSMQQKGSVAPVVILSATGSADVAVGEDPHRYRFDDKDHGEDHRRKATRGGLLRHVRSTIVMSTRAKGHPASGKPAVLQSSSSPPLSRVPSGGGGKDRSWNSGKETSRLRTTSAAATPLSAIRSRSTLFAPKRWSHFLHIRAPPIAGEGQAIVDAKNARDVQPRFADAHANPLPSSLPSISLPYNVRAAPGSALVNAVNNSIVRSAQPATFALSDAPALSNLQHVLVNRHNQVRKPGLDVAEINTWLQGMSMDNSSMEPTTNDGDITDQSIYVIAPENSIHSDDLSFSTCPTPVLDPSAKMELAATPTSNRDHTTSSICGTMSSSSPVTVFAPLARMSSSHDVSAWGSHPEGLLIEDNELSDRLRGMLRDQSECDKQVRLRASALVYRDEEQRGTLATPHHVRLRHKVSVADFLDAARKVTTNRPEANAGPNAHRLSVADTLDCTPSVACDSLCGHEDSVEIRTAWRANVAHVTRTEDTNERRGPGRSFRGRNLVLQPPALSSAEVDRWDCKTPRQRSIGRGKGRNNSCPPSPTTMLEGCGGGAKGSPTRSMTIAANNTSTTTISNDCESYDVCGHLLVRAQKHRRYAIYE